jgi:hypothetical protein
MQIRNHANTSRSQIESLNRVLSQHHTLEDVLKWGFHQPTGSMHPHVIAEVIVQDEFCHDVIVPWQDGLVIVYDTT